MYIIIAFVGFDDNKRDDDIIIDTVRGGLETRAAHVIISNDFVCIVGRPLMAIRVTG